MSSAPNYQSDIQVGDWIDRRLPAGWRPYARLARLDRPIGTWLLLFPCWWGFALALDSSHFTLAVQSLPQAGAILGPVLLFAVGAIVMRGAGCTYNDIVDRDFDAKVARTALRPIPSGQVSVRQAILFLIAQLLVGLLILLAFNRFTILLGVLSLALIFTYPLMKRVTYWPQAVLGLTFNWGALMGYAAMTGTLSASAIALYAAGFFWTLGYDTIYAHQDKEDDALIGVKSSALRLGTATRRWVQGFYLATVLLFAAAGALEGFALIYYVGLVPAAGHFWFQTRRLDIDDPARCLAIFKSNREAGILLLAPFSLEVIGRLA
ncbi:MAG: 4-hydroxybenzoate octaprenyltransferase [Rhodospirillales bacterium]|nr:4-hydroxybenzoate octaprenyltransferase [Rhodospirillales bacterium]